MNESVESNSQKDAKNRKKQNKEQIKIQNSINRYIKKIESKMPYISLIPVQEIPYYRIKISPTMQTVGTQDTIKFLWLFLKLLTFVIQDYSNSRRNIVGAIFIGA